MIVTKLVTVVGLVPPIVLVKVVMNPAHSEVKMEGPPSRHDSSPGY